MDTCLEVANKTDLAKYLGVGEANLTIKLYCDTPDTRIGWAKTYLVILQGFGPVGMCDADGT